MTNPVKNLKNSIAFSGNGEKYYRDLYKKHLLRLLLTYLIPFVLFILYFQFEYSTILSHRNSLHMKSIAENQAKTLDLFLRERVVNLMNLIDDPKVQCPPSTEMMQNDLQRLNRESSAFIDIGFFDSKGVQIEYAGPIPTLEKREYGEEKWYVDLKEQKERYIITDIYLGLRKKPHFTIGVKRIIDNKYIVMRATLDPEKIYEYMTSIEGAKDVYISTINRKGYYQLVTPHVGNVLDNSGIIPPDKPYLGTQHTDFNGKKVSYAYARLQNASWAVVVRPASNISSFNVSLQILIIGGLIILVILSIIFINARRLVRMEKDKDMARNQLEHASKLASVGELAGGIAHEINNPLAIIASEAGLMKDFMELKKEGYTGCEGMNSHLDNITEAAYRCRDITTRLLSFVRKEEFNLKEWCIHDLIDDVVSGFLEREMAVSGIQIERKYAKLPDIVIDGNQFKQVLLNIINNAVDAISPPGNITIVTTSDGKNELITITDTGKGMSEEQMQKVFLPFFTTKEVGKGTGLGLSVSYAIIKNLGGNINVESKTGEGSSFSIVLPIQRK
ncbi:MAG: ATP-binding protein [Fibrobacteria bacterium]|nr:ATP-binding protein [Fibrobacteria bacterium]